MLREGEGKREREKMTINSCCGGRGVVVSGMVRPSSSVPGVMSEAEHAAKMMKVTNVIVAVTDRLLCHFCTGFRSDQFEFSDLCYRLARIIDYAITFNHVPTNCTSIAALVKKVYQCRNVDGLCSAIMVFMMSVKSACQKCWFHVTESNELLNIANKVCSQFCVDAIASSEVSNTLKVISNVMLRFYPWMELNRLIVSFEIKSGYRIFVENIVIPRDVLRGEKIRLFVAQTDNLEASSCIISPPEVSFLINGRGVEKRTNTSLDKGPQFPTDITKMLNYGMNLFQAVGSFNGNFLIAITVIKKADTSSIPKLQNYSQTFVTEKDSEVTEGPSKVSLNCPISLHRIKTPVKGHLCRHHQCFDYANFMKMNSRKPTWRCPCCNQSLSFIDLRLDQNMFKILSEVGERDCDVLVYADGSLKVSKEHDSATTQLQSSTIIPSEPHPSSHMVDLTMEDDCTISNVHIKDELLQNHHLADWIRELSHGSGDLFQADILHSTSFSETQACHSFPTQRATQVTEDMLNNMIFSSAMETNQIHGASELSNLALDTMYIADLPLFFQNTTVQNTQQVFNTNDVQLQQQSVFTGSIIDKETHGLGSNYPVPQNVGNGLICENERQFSIASQSNQLQSMALGQSIPVQNQVCTRSLSNAEMRKASTSCRRASWQPYPSVDNSNYRHTQNQSRATASCYPPLYSEGIMHQLQTSVYQNMHQMANNYPVPMQPGRAASWHHNTFRPRPTSLADVNRRPSSTMGQVHNAVENLPTGNNFPVSLQPAGPWHHNRFRSPVSYKIPSSITGQVQNSIHSSGLQNMQRRNLPGLEQHAYF